MIQKKIFRNGKLCVFKLKGKYDIKPWGSVIDENSWSQKTFLPFCIIIFRIKDT